MEKSKDLWVSVLVVGFGVWYFAGDAIEGFFKPINRPDVRVEVRQLLSELSSNPVAAEQKYKGQTLAVTGPVYRIQAAGSGSVVSVGRLMNNIDCQLGEADASRVARLQSGQTVTVQGRLQLGGIFPAMKPCVVN